MQMIVIQFYYLAVQKTRGTSVTSPMHCSCPPEQFRAKVPYPLSFMQMETASQLPSTVQTLQYRSA